MVNSGGYKVRNNKIYVYGVVNGKRYRLSTSKEANPTNLSWMEKNYRDVLLKLIDKKSQTTKLTPDFCSFAKEVLELTSHKRDLETQKDYLSKLKRLILPYFKSHKIEDVKPLDIEKWQNMLLEKYSSTTVRRTRNIFHMVMKKAIANDLILKNPVEYSEKIQVVHKKQQPYTVEEMTKIMKNSTGWLKVFIFLAFTTGMRPGELIALQWNDIDFTKKVIKLKRSKSKSVIKEDTTTKNHNRIIIVADYVLNMLQELKTISKSEWIFVSRLGQPYSDSKAILNRHFKPLLQKIGVQFRNLKATRHTFISIMRNSGADVEFVLEMVGHSKAVSDSFYYTASVTDQKISVVNNCFQDFNFEKGTIKAQ